MDPELQKIRANGVEVGEGDAVSCIILFNEQVIIDVHLAAAAIRVRVIAEAAGIVGRGMRGPL